MRSGTAFTATDTLSYGYNTRSEVTSAASSEAATNEYSYLFDYDPMGNRLTATRGDAAPELTSYTTNSLNTYTAVATPSGTVNPLYDLDANMTHLPAAPGSGDPNWVCQWDAENRLVVAESATVRIEMASDYLSRRVAKQVYTGSSTAGWTLQSDTRFLFDGWNLIAEIDALSALPIYPDIEAKTYYVWGLDQSQSVHGAGGIGGLLCSSSFSSSSSSSMYFTFDANGNVSELLDGTGAVQAHYEYDPYGKAVVATGSLSADNPFRFSTKYLDSDTGLSYYGYRWYNTSMGRWLSRDPIGIDGGVNPYAFVRNSPTLFVDPFGLRPFTTAEQTAIAHMRALQTAIATNPTERKVAEKIGSFIADFTAQVVAVPDNQKDPANVAIAATAIVIWDTDSDKFKRFQHGKEKDTPVSNLTTLKKDVVITCSYYVADVIQRATGEHLGKRSWRGNVWPPVANDYAYPKKDVRLKNFSEVQTGGVGDVISFPVTDDSGHVGIYLGYDIYISARTGDAPGTTGKNPVQPFSGVQIKEVPMDERHIIVRYRNQAGDE